MLLHRSISNSLEDTKTQASVFVSKTLYYLTCLMYFFRPSALPMSIAHAMLWFDCEMNTFGIRLTVAIELLCNFRKYIFENLQKLIFFFNKCPLKFRLFKSKFVQILILNIT